MTATKNNSQTILTCSSVTKQYGSLVAVNGLSLEVNAGEIVGIGGPNGAGKTTLFDIISGVTPPSGGHVWFKGRDISLIPADRICHLGIAKTFQLNAAFGSMSVRDNIACSGYFGRRNIVFPALRYPKKLQREVDETMELTGLRDQADLPASALTVLQRKKLMIACALITNPELLLLDEPVGGLNPHEIDDTIELIKRVRHERSLTIVLIEHVMRFIVELCDRVVIMHHGQKMFEGTADRLTTDKKVVEVFLGAGAARRLDHLLEERPHNA